MVDTNTSRNQQGNRKHRYQAHSTPQRTSIHHTTRAGPDTTRTKPHASPPPTMMHPKQNNRIRQQTRQPPRDARVSASAKTHRLTCTYTARARPRAVIYGLQYEPPPLFMDAPAQPSGSGAKGRERNGRFRPRTFCFLRSTSGGHTLQLCRVSNISRLHYVYNTTTLMPWYPQHDELPSRTAGVATA